MFKELFVLMGILSLLSACAIDPLEEETTDDNVPAPLMGISAARPVSTPASDSPSDKPKLSAPALSADDIRVQSGRSSRYKSQDHGTATASGEIYDMFDLTAAHPTLPFGSFVRITNTVNQRSVVVRINDRNTDNKLVRLSHRAAKLLSLPAVGGFVKMQALQPKAK